MKKKKSNPPLHEDIGNMKETFMQKHMIILTDKSHHVLCDSYANYQLKCLQQLHLTFSADQLWKKQPQAIHCPFNLDPHLSPPAKPTLTPTAASSTAEWLISKRRGQHDPTEKVNNRSVLLHPFLFFVPRVLLRLVVHFPGGSDVEGLVLPHDHVLGENHRGDVRAWHLKHGLQQKRFLHKAVAPVQSHTLFLPVTEAATAGAQQTPTPPPPLFGVYRAYRCICIYMNTCSASHLEMSPMCFTMALNECTQGEAQTRGTPTLKGVNIYWH